MHRDMRLYRGCRDTSSSQERQQDSLPRRSIVKANQNDLSSRPSVLVLLGAASNSRLEINEEDDSMESEQ
ncbi:hypothetical protein L484_021729 [Morus notabilis]|uniref:Uncharacterized protein n=1 Tax=Morus notabilis TaxID=981085 RepID=W9RWD9_9ROSA|nr:hypothetical protein L484_021729 [Morus notabilis]